MKRSTGCFPVLILALCLCFGEGLAQPDSTIIAHRMRFAVPDAPAFKLIKGEPGAIMRPSSTREIAITIAEFLRSGGTLPSAFAAEFSPYLVACGSRLTLSEFRQSAMARALYRTRLSIASRREETATGRTQVSVGLRFTLMDEADLRLDEQYLSTLFGYSDSIASISLRIKDEIRGPRPFYASSADSLRAEQQIQEETRSLASSIVTSRERAKEENWSKPIVEVGLAWAGWSDDSVGVQGIVGSDLAAWFVAAGGIGPHAQWVAGAQLRLSRDDLGRLRQLEGPVAARVYLGENAYKLYAQAEAEWLKSTADRYLFEGGGETHLTSGIWLDVGIGIEWHDGTKPRLSSKFNLRFGTI